MRVSIVTTLYQSAPYLLEFYERAVKAVKTLPHQPEYEIVFVDDGSPDNSLSVVRGIAKADPQVRIVALSRNFGHFKAMQEGLAYASGDLVFLIDCDLEEPPELLPLLYEKMMTGTEEDPIDVTYGIQKKRKGKWFERVSGQWFWNLFNWLSNTQIPSSWMVARLMTRRYVHSLLLHDEKEVFMSGLMVLTGFRQEPVFAEKKSKGKTTYTLRRKLTTVLNAITSFSATPLIFIFLFGMVISFTSLAAILWFLFFRYLLGVTYLTGWSSLMLTICFFGGAILASIGVIGIYLGKIFIEVKHRPSIIKEVHPKGLQKTGPHQH